ncbi:MULTISPECIES: hypothetical protein [unclassified Pseudomonas]|uniref:hypothetical protein n=1 Tax=unclassified Pseudomonas TaxID=196821 RepID=UPI001A9308D1|nr:MULTISPECIES: hypothetical protein [unclassified Pseudomonas]
MTEDHLFVAPGHRQMVEHDTQDSLTSIVYGKNARFHDYFDRGIARMKLAAA